jgi:ABC-type sugar transport system permease subunit
MYSTGFEVQRGGYASAIAVAGFLISMLVVVAVLAFRRGDADAGEGPQ